MKKILVSLIALVMCNMMSWGEVSLDITPKSIDFGTVYLDANGKAEPDDYAMATLSYTLPYGVYNVDIDTLGVQSPNCEFSAVSVRGYDFWYDDGYGHQETDVYVSFYAVATGDYSVTYQFYIWQDWNWEVKAKTVDLAVSVKVRDKATAIDEAQAKVESRKELRNGRLVIIRNGEKYNMMGAKE